MWVPLVLILSLLIIGVARLFLPLLSALAAGLVPLVATAVVVAWLPDQIITVGALVGIGVVAAVHVAWEQRQGGA